MVGFGALQQLIPQINQQVGVTAMSHALWKVQADNFQTSLLITILSNNLTDFSRQQYYCHVEFPLKLFDKMVKNKKIISENYQPVTL